MRWSFEELFFTLRLYKESNFWLWIKHFPKNFWKRFKAIMFWLAFGYTMESIKKTNQFLDKLKNMYPNISVIYNNENIGYSKANNIGAFLSSSPYLIFLNSDTFPIDDSLYKMINFMDKSEYTSQ